MTDYELCYLPCARQDIRDAVNFIQRKGPGAKEMFLADFAQEAAQVARQPEGGVIPGDDLLASLGYRMKRIGNYFMFYRIQEQEVLVYRFLQGFYKYEFLMKSI